MIALATSRIVMNETLLDGMKQSAQAVVTADPLKKLWAGEARSQAASVLSLVDEVLEERATNKELKKRLQLIEEERRWRHIEQEQPENNQLVLIPCPQSWVDALVPVFYRKEKSAWDYMGLHYYSCSGNPRWQPTPTRGPTS